MLTNEEKRKVFEEEKLRGDMKGKNPILAVFLSFLIPGLGDLYCGSWIKAIIFLVLSFISFILMFAMGIGIFLWVPVWFCGLISAWLSANKSMHRQIKKVDRNLD